MTLDLGRDKVSLENLVQKVPHISMSNGSDKILTPFGPMIYQTFLSNEEVSLLLSEGNKLTQEIDNYSLSLAGNMKRGNSFRYKEEFRNNFAPVIMDKANLFVSGVSKVFGFKLPESENMDLFDLWINYQKPNDFNPIHTHSHFLSFVVYCDVPQTIFEEQAESNLPVAGHISFNYGEAMTPLSNQSFVVKPENNLMFIFPAKLSHTVYPFYSEGTRVSVAGNISCNYLI
jgi:hypothetical protein